jgi:hypothetical protein
MGLDMYAYRVPASKVRVEDKNAEVDFESYYGDGADEFFYWRKHPNLHGAFGELYREKNGSKDSFNYATLRLTDKDLVELEQKIKNKELPFTAGFFFGTSDDDDDAINRDLEFIREARKFVANGDFVYYDSSW